MPLARCSLITSFISEGAINSHLIRSMWTFTLSIFLLLGVLLTFPSNASNESYFIVSSHDQCDSLEDQACFTLSSFAANTSNYLQSKNNDTIIELVLYPGNHTLQSKLAITHINQLWLYSNTAHSLSTIVVCIGDTTKFEFTNVTRILIFGVKFLGCRGNRAKLVMDFTMINVIFDGQQNELYLGTAIKVVNSTIKGEKASVVTGGAMTVNQSIATFLNCTFEGNHALLGGAIYGDLFSNISVINSTFDHNFAAEYGGAIFIGALTVESNDTRCTCGMLSVLASKFLYNKAKKRGGGVAVFYVNVATHESKFMNNMANSTGGALFSNKTGIANISRTDFSGNNATRNGGAVHVFNSTLLIFNSTFSRNSAVNGHGGALCLEEGTYDFSDCNFYFNEAKTFGGAIYTRNSQYEYLMRCFFNTNTVRSPIGGGRSMRIYREPKVVITNSSFSDQGYLTYNNEDHNHTSNCQESNAGYRVSGVGLIIASSTIVFNSTKIMGNCESVYAYKCNINFTGNNNFININNEQSKAPSALYIILSTVSVDENCTFMNNTAVSGGAIHAVESRIDVNGKLVVINNMALDNGGGIYLYRSDFNCRINSAIEIVGNTAHTEGGGIHAISSAIKVTYIRDSYSGRSSLNFSGNTATNGGGVYLEANARLIVLKEGTNGANLNHSSSIFFMGNQAKECGGAVYVADETNAATCEGAGAINSSHHSDANECFFQVFAMLLSEKIRNNRDLVAIDFANNSAPSGPVLFGGLLDRCTVSPMAEIHKVNSSREHFGISVPGITYLSHVSNISIDDLRSLDIRSKPVQICFCVGNNSDCNHHPSPVKVTHGKEFNISLVAVDQVNHTVENVSIFSSMESSLNWLSKGQIVQNTSDNCTDLTFSILSSGNLSVPHNDTLHLYADGPCKSANHSIRTIEVLLQPCNCAHGFELHSEKDKCNCECDPKLKDYTTICDVIKGVLVRENNFWISATTDSSLTFCDSSKYLGHINCPFDYCVSENSKVEINLSKSNGADVQCANNRVGILCSQCKQGYSLSIGSSSCTHCSKTWVVQMIGIVLAILIMGITLVTLLLVLNLTVAVGTINGLVFYANIVGSISEPLKFALPNFVVAWINLDLGFNGCFINGLDAYWKTWLKFVFPMYVFFLVASVIIVSRFSSKFSRIIGKRNPLATLNTLILLSYSKLLHAVISIFLFTTLDCPGGSSKLVKVWVVDATIKYFSPKHFVLFVVAILVILTGMVYTFLLFSWQWLLLYQDKWLFRWVRNQKLCQFLEPYHAPYTFKHRYWTGLLLLVRVTLFALLATNTSQDPYASLVAISIAVSSLFLIKGVFSRIYRNVLPNILETFCLMNIIFLCITNFYTMHKGYTKLQKDVAYVSGSIITLLFLFVIAYHAYTEIIIKSRLWVVLNESILKSKAMIRDVATIHHAVTSAQPSSYTTSVVEAPKKDDSEQSKLKYASYAEPNLRELLLESSVDGFDGTANFLY